MNYRKLNIFLTVLLIFLTGLFYISRSQANFSDTEKILGNSIQVGVWGEGSPEPTPTSSEIIPTPTEIIVPTPTETPTSTPTPSVVGSVVINEVMWMGSHESTSDEWIELKNTTTSPIDLTGWIITNAGSGSDSSITLSESIPANGYFLVSHYASTASSINNSITVNQVVAGISLVDTGEQLILKNTGKTIIDQTPSGAWPKGVNSTGTDPDKSMERNDIPGTGLNATDWYTCTNDACNDTIYWDAEGNNYGTPKAPNL